MNAARGIIDGRSPLRVCTHDDSHRAGCSSALQPTLSTASLELSLRHEVLPPVTPEKSSTPMGEVETVLVPSELVKAASQEVGSEPLQTALFGLLRSTQTMVDMPAVDMIGDFKIIPILALTQETDPKL